MSEQYNFTKDEIIKAINETGAFITSIAQKLGCSSRTAKQYINKFEDTKILYDDKKKALLDKAEQNIQEAVENGDIVTSRWLLSLPIAKGRGYRKDELSPKLQKKLEEILNKLMDDAYSKTSPIGDFDFLKDTVSFNYDSLRSINSLLDYTK